MLKIPCLNPENHSVTVIPIVRKIPFKISLNLLNYYNTNSLLSENNFVVPNVILSDFGKKSKKARFQTSTEFVYHHHQKRLEEKKKLEDSDEEMKITIPISTKTKKKSLTSVQDVTDDFDELELFNKNTRYCRARVLIKWTQSFHWDGTEEEFKAQLKDIIFNKKLSSIPDRNKLSMKLDSVINSYVKYETIPTKETEQVDEDADNIYIEVSYNILNKNLGELVSSSIKSMFIGKE